MINRIRELLDTRQLSPTQFADLIGVGRPVISHILSERNKPSLEVVQKVISAFPDVSLSWLMSGTGQMLNTATSPPTTAPSLLPNASVPAAPVLDSAPVARAIAPSTAPSAAINRPPVAPTPTVAVASAPALLPATGAILPVAQPTRLPQPLKFRPAAKAATYAESPLRTTTPDAVLPVSPVTATSLATPSPVPPPLLVPEPAAPSVPNVSPVISVAATPSLPMATEVAPIASVYPASAENIATATAVVPAPALADQAATTSNPAAAFSFLGEAGKTIRRIVLFYNDGSFSDYRPEG